MRRVGRSSVQLGLGMLLAAAAIGLPGALGTSTLPLASTSWGPPSARAGGSAGAAEHGATGGGGGGETEADDGDERPGAGTAGSGQALRGLEQAPEVASYRMEVSLDPASHLIRGEAEVRWTNTSRVAQSEVYLHLYLNAFKNERSVFMRSDQGAGFRGGGRPAEWGHVQVKSFRARELDAELWPEAEPHTPDDPEDQTDVRLALPEPVAPGEGLTFDVVWQSLLPSLVLRTGHVGRFHMVGQWFPKLARLEPDGRWAHFAFHRLSEFYADFGHYDVTIEVPEGFEVGATGKLVSEISAAGQVRRRFVQAGVHDFAFTAWDRFEVREAEGPAGVRVRCLFPPGAERAAERELSTARAGLEHLGAAYGRYPYEVLTLVHPPEWASEAGGMEYPTLITTGGRWFWPHLGSRALEQVTIHELSHQWFYGLVASDEHRWPFLDEGLGSYAEMEALEAQHPGSSAFEALGFRVGLPAGVRYWAADGWDNDIIAQPSGDFATGSDYGALVYGKAAALLATLARVHGAERMQRALGRYARDYRFGHPGPEDFLATMEDELGPQAAEQLAGGLYERRWVDYLVDRVEPAFALVARQGSFVFPVDVLLIDEEGQSERVRWDGMGSPVRLQPRAGRVLAAVVVDPDHQVLLDRDLSNNARQVKAAAIPWAPRVLAHGAYASGVLLAVLAP